MTDQQQYARNRVKQLTEKYSETCPESSGIYALLINNQIVYVGQSKNLAQRIAQHAYELEKRNPKEKKYQILKEVIHKYQQPISFQVLEQTDNLNERENYYIEKFTPILNTVTPSGIHSLATIDAEQVCKEVGVDLDNTFIF